MPQVTIRNLNYISSKDNLMGQAISDLVNLISNLQAQVQTLQSQVAALEKK